MLSGGEKGRIMLTIELAGPLAFDWAQRMVVAHHYLRSPVDVRCRPLAYVLRLGAEPVGCLVFGRTQSTSCYQGELTYGSGYDVRTGRALFDRWRLLNLARVWLSPDVQHGGRLARPELMPGVPGHTDRKGVYWPYVASWAIGQALRRVGFDYLAAHPPCFVEQPYQIGAVLSYCDTRLHRGTIYRAAGFRLARRNADGIETWWTQAVAPLTAEQDLVIRRQAERDARAARIRRQRVEQPTLFGE